MPTGIVRREGWGHRKRTELHVKLDPTGIAMWPADSGCQMHITVEVTPDGTKIGGPCLLAVQGTLRIADAASQTGVEFAMQALAPHYRTLRIPMTTADIVRIQARRAEGQLMCSLR